MPQFNEADWKLFRTRLPGWQEEYMDRLNREYAAILAGSGKASEKFWALEEKINRDKRTVSVTARMSRSNMDYNIAGLLGGGVITIDDLDGFFPFDDAFVVAERDAPCLGDHAVQDVQQLDDIVVWHRIKPSAL